jgi:multidrug efflux pump subunit AcrA (membrane-fusion protein)
VRLWTQPDVALAGRVREIAPSADAATRTYAVRVSIVDPLPALQLGMTANVVLADAAAAPAACWCRPPRCSSMRAPARCG